MKLRLDPSRPAEHLYGLTIDPEPTRRELFKITDLGDGLVGSDGVWKSYEEVEVLGVMEYRAALRIKLATAGLIDWPDSCEQLKLPFEHDPED